jgi:hypothetical protein
MFNPLKDQLHSLTQRWRKTAEQARPVQEAAEDVFFQGHLQGLSDGLLIAAGDVDKLLAEPNGKVRSNGE